MVVSETWALYHEAKEASVKRSCQKRQLIKFFDFNGLNGVNGSVDWLCSLGSGRLDNSKQSCQSSKLVRSIRQKITAEPTFL